MFYLYKLSGNLRVPGDQGKRTFIDSLIKRGDYNSVKVEERKDQVINFESKIFNDKVSYKIRWHKDCYSAFVSKRNLQFVFKETPSCQGDNQGDSLPSTSTRSKINSLPDFENLCMFAKKTKHKKCNRVIKVESKCHAAYVKPIELKSDDVTGLYDKAYEDFATYFEKIMKSDKALRMDTAACQKYPQNLTDKGEDAARYTKVKLEARILKRFGNSVRFVDQKHKNESQVVYTTVLLTSKS